MSLIPQGVSGTSGVGGSFNFANYPHTIAPGRIYELSRWTRHTLRHLSITGIASASMIFSILQIAPDYPRGSLRPENALRDALFTHYLNTAHFFNSPHILLTFDPGLITVLPGERLYIVIYDWVSNGPSDSLIWSLNMLWEPMVEEV